jgi:hypothetical protein
MEHGPCWEANSLLDSHVIPRLLWNPKIHYRITRARYWTLPCAPWIQCRTHFFKLHLNIILAFTPRSPKWSVPFRFSDQNLVCTSHLPIRATCSALVVPSLLFLVGSCTFRTVKSHHPQPVSKNSTLLTVDLIPLCTKKFICNPWLQFRFPWKKLTVFWFTVTDRPYCC